MASSNTSVARSNPSGSQYPFPSHVNAASFVSIKLKNKTNYGRWLEQIKCLVECHGMLGFVNGELTCPDEDSEEWKRSDTLVKGWIFGSLSEDAMGTVVGLQTANDVWEKLKTSYGQQQSTSIRSLQRCMAPSLTSTTITEKDTAEYLPLCEAIMTNNWEKAKEIFNQDQGAVTAPISIDGNTALHLAINRVENIQFLENLLKEIEPDILPTLVSKYEKDNPLHRAAYCDNKIAAEMLVKKNPHLLFLLDDIHLLPIQGAVCNSNRTTFRYLLEACENHIELSREDGYHSPFQGTRGAHILAYAITQGFLDVSYELIMKYPHMARTGTYRNDMCPLSSIAAQWYTYYSGTRYSYFQNFVYSCLPIDINFSCDKHNIQDIENQQTRNAKLTTKCTKSCVYSGIRRIYVKFWKVAIIYVPGIKHLNGEKVKHREAHLVLKCICEEVGKLTKERDMRDLYWNALWSAVYNDTVEVVEEIIKYYPAALLISMNGYTVTQFAITNRCEKTYSFLLNSLFYDKYANQRTLDKDGNSLLHLAAQLAPKHKLDLVNGAALQMQREVQWFEEVKNFVKPIYKELKNHKGETPIMMFRREHVQLRKEGEEWMKKTADSYTITAALIITIVFAAAITVPGGNDSNSGKAIFASKSSFIIFGVSDAISLFTSTTSLLLFLSILTTRFRDEDFLYRLPKRLILGLAMLFLSVTSMMVAFSATLYLTYGQGEAWILIPIATLACLPIASFVTLQLPLLADMISSTYGRGIFAKKSGHKEKLP